VADGCVCKGLDGHFIRNKKPAVVLNEVSEATRKEIHNSVAWVCKHGTASAFKFNEAAAQLLNILVKQFQNGF